MIWAPFEANAILGYSRPPMITRYSRPEMSALWSDHARYGVWLEVETVALEELAVAGLAPLEAAQAVRAKGRFEAERVDEIEREVKHDVIAFLTNVAEHVGPLSRFVHRGMTSSDLVDTALAIQLVRSSDLILAGLDRVLDGILVRAKEFKATPCIGRSHGIHAEPTTFGLKLLTWWSELSRARNRIVSARSEIAVGKISGAVGTNSLIDPKIEGRILERLELTPEPVATQVVARDRHAAFFSSLALLATSIERCCVEVRHLQRSEVREAEERFTAGQKGSSAMPHKRNPILSENLCGLARLMRSYSQAAIEDVALWHERDISHSSVERVIGPDACTLIDFMLHRFDGIVRGLVVYPERMRANLEVNRGLPFSGALLVALVDHGITRETAYQMVQAHALAAWEGGMAFPDRVLGDDKITAVMPVEKVRALFDLQHHLRNVDAIFMRTVNGIK